MNIYSYKLKFHSGFHIDSIGNSDLSSNDNFIHSDTLSSAIMANWTKIYDEFLLQNGKLPYVVSSCFPFIENTLFFPTPKKAQNISFIKSTHRKAFKKIKWVDKEYFDDLNGLIDFNNPKNLSKLLEDISNITKCNGTHLIKKNNQKKILPKVSVSNLKHKNAVDRNSNTALDGYLFDISKVAFTENSGLYFFVKFDSENEKQQFETILAILADEGIGAKRSIGLGGFTIINPHGDKSDIKIATKGDENITLLSLATPLLEERNSIVFNDNSKYELINRGGWIANTSYRKNRIWTLAESSVLGGYIAGSILDITPKKIERNLNHKIYRDLRAFCIKN